MASDRLSVNKSTVFRSLQRLERELGTHLFERSRSGYQATDLALSLAKQGERIELALDQASAAIGNQSEDISGTLRISTSVTVLQGLLVPTLKQMQQKHPALRLDLKTGNDFVNLTQRDSDIAIRATNQPPEHLVGRKIGPIKIAIYAKAGLMNDDVDFRRNSTPWIAADEAIPQHPSVKWRKRHLPKVQPQYLVDNILAVKDLVKHGLGVGILPLFLAQNEGELTQLSDELEDGRTDLWILTHPESRHLSRISRTYQFLSETITLP